MNRKVLVTEACWLVASWFALVEFEYRDGIEKCFQQLRKRAVAAMHRRRIAPVG